MLMASTVAHVDAGRKACYYCVITVEHVSISYVKQVHVHQCAFCMPVFQR